ncbi:MAG: (2Fe-2S) ferredoxin domain-containing protein [Candidatus Tenebribacter davisii]|jgi:(2Fe-2S) ferredoxin|nr:(2Fe-2S) ferredoxin domain-containing protein [Candidatus Tenebribacter davisii]
MNLENLRNIREKAQTVKKQSTEKGQIKLIVSMSTSGIAAGARAVMTTIMEEIKERNIENVIIAQTGEKGLQTKEPIVIVEAKDQPRIIYGNVTPEIIKMIIVEHILNNQPVQKYIFHTE